MTQLLIVIASTRPGRVGLPVGRWVERRAREHGAFDVAVADLAELELPMMDEPNHPRLARYEHAHTKAWSRTVAAADAIVLVMPEYNYGYPAPLKNAIDYLHDEWRRKPAGCVSYGGVSGGLRAAQALVPVLLAVGMLPAGAVPIPFVAQAVQDDELAPTPPVEQGLAAMLDELVTLEAASRTLRAA